MIAAVHADKNMRDVRMVLPSRMEFAYGKDENDFELRLPEGSERLECGGYVYVDGTEHGGLVTDFGADPDERQHVYGGMTWHGMLAAKVLSPDSGQDYLTVSGELNAVIGSLIGRVGLGLVMSAPKPSSGVVVRSLRLNRYCTAYEGICAVMDSVGMAPRIVCVGGAVTVAPERKRTVVRTAKVERHTLPVNHLVCLGKGELAARTVLHLYADAAGKVGKTQTLKGAMERTEVYDYSSAEESELEEKGIEKLQEYQVFAEASFSDLGTDELFIGDVVSCYDSATDTSVSVPIEKKIASYKANGLSVSYEAGDAVIKTGKM